MNEERYRQNFRDKFEEGKKINDIKEIEKRNIERIKQQKLEELERLNIPAKYKADLEKFKI